jgi:hypothetical protein
MSHDPVLYPTVFIDRNGSIVDDGTTASTCVYLERAGVRYVPLGPVNGRLLFVAVTAAEWAEIQSQIEHSGGVLIAADPEPPRGQ